MGLDFAYRSDILLYEDEEDGKVYDLVMADCWFGYIHFMHYREMLFKTFDDRNLNQMLGFCQDLKCDEDCNKCTKYDSWADIKNPLKYLIHHSDVDGEIEVSKLRLLIPALKEATPQIENRYLSKHLKLIIFMEECIKNNKSLIFL